MEVTGKNQDECIVALHDCNGDVNRAINILLEGSSDTVRFYFHVKLFQLLRGHWKSHVSEVFNFHVSIQFIIEEMETGAASLLMRTLKKAESGKCSGCSADLLQSSNAFIIYSSFNSATELSAPSGTGLFLAPGLCTPSTALRPETIIKVNLCKPKGGQIF